MHKWALAAMAMLISGAVHAAQGTVDLSECAFPDAPVVPDGTTASKEQMLDGVSAMRTYVADTETALACLSGVEESLGEEITPEQKTELVETYNTRFESMNQIAEQVNEQIRAYNAR